MIQILLLLCLILFMYVLFIDHKNEYFENQKNLDVAEIAALEIDKIKKRIDMQYNTILNTQNEIGMEETENYKSNFINMINDIKTDYKKAELEMLRAEVASPKSGPTIRSRESMVHMKNLIEKLNIVL